MGAPEPATLPAVGDVDAPEELGPVSLVVDEVHVKYQVSEDRHTTIKEVLAALKHRRPTRYIHALKGVSLHVRSGESVGIIGSNGSGKSTLLQAAAGLLPPTSGKVYARHRPVVLGVETSLVPRLSGRRNIVIGGLALGLSRAEIDEKLEDVVSFAGLEDFIDMPMKTYSSGMKTRLQFAIATLRTPEILFIDEALGAGDRKFKKRTKKRLREIHDAAGTVLLVSHNLNEIRRLCDRVVWLEKGVILADGDPDEVIEAYKAEDPDDDDDE